jgi:hypothetical protein
MTTAREQLEELKRQEAALKPLVRAERISVFIITKTSKNGKSHRYWHCSWRNYRNKNHSEYLGSCEKITETEALEKARKKKAEDLAIGLRKRDI